MQKKLCNTKTNTKKLYQQQPPGTKKTKKFHSVTNNDTHILAIGTKNSSANRVFFKEITKKLFFFLKVYQSKQTKQNNEYTNGLNTASKEKKITQATTKLFNNNNIKSGKTKKREIFFSC